jgi:hypothetical protein
MWEDETDTGFHSCLVEGNFSGSFENFTGTKSGTTCQYSRTLPNSNATYAWKAYTNDTWGASNATELQTFTVTSFLQNPITIYVFDRAYGITQTVAAWCTSGYDVALEINGTAVSNPSTWTPTTTGSYNVTAYTNATGSYYANSTTKWISITNATLPLNFYLNGSSASITVTRYSNVSLQANTSLGYNLTLSSNVTGFTTVSNTTVIYNVTNMTTIGTFNFTATAIGWGNYSGTNTTYYVTVRDISIAYPPPYKSLTFIPGSTTQNNTVPKGQTLTIPGLNVTNLMTYQISVNISTPIKPNCMRYTFSNSSNRTLGFAMNSTTQSRFARTVNASTWGGIWVWADFVGCSGTMETLSFEVFT